MLFLLLKLKKMISEESGIIMKDDQCGATWAYELAGQTIVCPASIQEVNSPGQMLIEVAVSCLVFS